MIKVKYRVNYGPGDVFEDVEEFTDDTTDDEIEETLKELVYQKIDWNWEKVN